MIRFIIHPGYAKTATTFLQENIFSQLDDVLYLGMFRDSLMLSNDFTTMFSTIFPRFINTGVNEIRARNSSLLIPTLGDLVLKEITKEKKNLVLLSNERLFDYGHYNGELNQFLLSKLIRYLKNNSDQELQFQIIMTIRNQKDVLHSYYAYFYKDFKKRFPSFEDFLRFGLDNKHEIIFGSYYYDSVLKDIQDIFGTANVHVFLYERMRQDIRTFLHEILQIIGTNMKVENFDYGATVNVNSEDGSHRMLDVESGFIANFLKGLRRVYAHVPTRLRWLESNASFQRLRATVLSHSRMTHIVSRGILREFSPEFADAIDVMYQDSNNKLSQMLNADLEQYGYVGGR